MKLLFENFDNKEIQLIIIVFLFNCLLYKKKDWDFLFKFEERGLTKNKKI